MASRRSINWSSMVRCGARSDASRRTLNTNRTVAMASATQATAMSTLLKVALRFALGPRQKCGVDGRTAGGCELSFLAPVPSYVPDQNQRQNGQQHRHDPRQQIETLLRRLDQHRRAVLRHIGGQNRVVGFVFGHSIVEIFLHPARGFTRTRKRSVGMAALPCRIFADA